MAYSPHKVQAEAHKAFLIDGYKKGVLYWGRQVGKSIWSIQQLVFSAILNQGQHFIVFKEYQQAEQVAWTQYLHTIPQGLIAKTDKSSLTITFNYIGTNANGDKAVVKFPEPIGERVIEHDETKPPSSIRLLGSDKHESHRGAKAMGMIMDEYQDQDPKAWASVYSKFFATTNGWVCYMGTAKDIDHWNELLDLSQNNENYYYSKATYRDTPYISKEWVEEDKKDAIAKGELGIWMQEMELVPFNIQGVVYPMFDKNIHIIKPIDVPVEGTDYITVDFGFAEGHPAAVCFVRITADDVWYVYDEIHGTGIQIDDMIAQIREKTGDRRITAIIADSARPDLIDYMQSKGLPVIPAPKKPNSVPAGIQLLAQRLQPKIQIIGEPKPNLYFSSICKKSIYDFTHYKYKEIKANRPAMELPEKRFDDACFVKGTMIATPSGDVAIEKLKIGDEVITPFGVSKVLGAGSTGIRQVVDYGVFKSTPNHKILTNTGLVKADALSYTNIVWELRNNKFKELSLTELYIAGILNPQTPLTELTFQALLIRKLMVKLNYSTEQFGSSIMARFLKDTKSIIKTDQTTTRLNRLSVLLEKNTQVATSGEATILKGIWKELENLRLNGIKAQRGESGIGITVKKLGKIESLYQQNAKSVTTCMSPTDPQSAGFVVGGVKPQTYAEEEVFNLATTDGVYFANKVLVSNCDSIRYLALFFKYGQVNKSKPINAKPKFNEFGL